MQQLARMSPSSSALSLEKLENNLGYDFINESLYLDHEEVLTPDLGAIWEEAASGSDLVFPADSFGQYCSWWSSSLCNWSDIYDHHQLPWIMSSSSNNIVNPWLMDVKFKDFEDICRDFGWYSPPDVDADKKPLNNVLDDDQQEDEINAVEAKPIMINNINNAAAAGGNQIHDDGVISSSCFVGDQEALCRSSTCWSGDNHHHALLVPQSGMLIMRYKSSSSGSLLEVDEIQKYFDVPITKAAKELKVGLTVLKKRCRELNIKRWPHRKIKSLKSLIHNAKELGYTSDQIDMLEEHKRMLKVVPEMELTDTTKKLRQACFKANYKKRRAMQQAAAPIRPL